MDANMERAGSLRGRKQSATAMRRSKLGVDAARASYSIIELCKQNGISRATYYNLKKAGHGPREIRFGRAVRVSIEAAAEWLQNLEGRA